MRLLFALALVACSSPSTPEPAPVASPAPVQTPDADAVEAADGPYSVLSHTSLGSTPPTEPTTVGALSFRGDLTVTIRNLSHYCDPVPGFTLSKEEGTLTLTLVRPDVVSRCIGGHDMELKVPGVDIREPLVDELVVAAPDGTVLATGSIGRAR